MKKKGFVSVVAVAVIAFGGLAWLSQGCKKQDAVVKVGAVLPLTGGGASYGVSLKQGMDLAVENINAAGGINGAKLEILYEDSKSEPKTGVSAFKKLTTIDKVPLVFGSLSSIILAIQPEADKTNVVLINTSAKSPLICENATDFLFSLMLNGDVETIFMAKELQRRFPNEKIAVLHSNDASGVDTKDKFVQNLNQVGNSNYITESYELGVTDFKIQLDRIKKSNAKYGYLIAFSSKEFADIFKQTKELGLDIKWFSYSGIETKETISLTGDAANGVIYSYPKCDEALYSKLQEKFVEKYNSWADLYAVTSYDGVYLTAAVLKDYGTNAIDIQRGLRSIEFSGIFGKINFANVGKQCVNGELMWKTIENNQFKTME